MELFRRRSAWQRNNIVMRLGCFLVSASMLVSLVLQPPKAKALLSEASLATSVIWTFMQSAGLSFSGNNAGSQQWIDSCQRWYNKFMESKEDNAGGFVGWLGYDSWGDFLKVLKFKRQLDSLGVPSTGYTIAIPKPIASKLAEFTKWFIGELGLTSGGESKPVLSVQGGYTVTLKDGSSLKMGKQLDDTYYSPGDIIMTVPSERDTSLDGVWHYIYFSDDTRLGCSLNTYNNLDLYYNFMCGHDYGQDHRNVAQTGPYKPYYDYISLAVKDDGHIVFIGHNCYKSISNKNYLKWLVLSGTYDFFTLDWINANAATVKGSAIDAAQPGAIDIPVDDTGDRATIITIPGLDTEIASINDLLQQILDKLAANEMAATGTVAQQPTPEQPDEDKPDLNGLGLPALGAALVTRFPFSIPWDVVKGIKLVAAPAEAPRWEVDFLAPIAGRVGGWKGSTKVVIDMGEYPIIGQLCRWTSMIGFCLILASGTKKLIWTA